MAARASIVLMDEPTSSLPREDVDAAVRADPPAARASGVAVVYISHFLEEVREIADRFTVLRDGRSVATGDARRRRPTSALIAHMVGRPVDALFPDARAGAAGRRRCSTSTDAGGAAGRAPGVAAGCARGEILGIAGLVGSGRTETGARADGPRAGGERGRARARTASRAHGVAGDASRRRPRLPERGSQGRGPGARRCRWPTTSPARAIDACSTRGLAAAAARSATRPRAGSRRSRVKARSPWQAARTLSGGNQQKVALARLLHQRCRRAAARRADQGHRHRQQGGDLSRHRRRGATRGDGGADGQLLPARAVRRVRFARGDVPRPADAGAPDRASGRRNR